MTTSISGLPRNTPRAVYRALHRMARQARHVADDMWRDALLYGAGFAVVDETGYRAIPPDEVRIG